MRISGIPTRGCRFPSTTRVSPEKTTRRSFGRLRMNRSDGTSPQSARTRVCSAEHLPRGEKSGIAEHFSSLTSSTSPPSPRGVQGGSGAPTCTSSRIDRPCVGTFRGGTPWKQHPCRQHDPADAEHGGPSSAPTPRQARLRPAHSDHGQHRPDGYAGGSHRPVDHRCEQARSCVIAILREHVPPSIDVSGGPRPRSTLAAAPA